jgi:hypothetical protein
VILEVYNEIVVRDSGQREENEKRKGK